MRYAAEIDQGEMMTRSKRAGWGLIAGALVFAVGALIPVLSGYGLNGPLFVLPVLWFIIGVKKSQTADSTPPNA
jgi:hypothetical protein